MTKLMTIVAALVLAVAGLSTAQAQTIDQLIAKGTIRIGVNSAAPPFSFVNSSGKVEGYDVDVGNAIAKYLGVKAEFTPYATAARIPALQSGKIDIVVATLTPTPARARVVMFTMPYVTFTTNVVAAKSSDVHSFEDLAGKTVSVARGTPQEVALVAAAAKSTHIARFDNDAIAFQALASGQASATVVPATIFEEFKKAHPDTKLELKFLVARQFMSIAVRMDAFELRQWLNTVVSWMRVNGELDKISEKWTGRPFPKNAPVF
ncbi:MAG: transporter substrate-binding domain-containing protein [Acetobacteraceae bacterium]